MKRTLMTLALCLFGSGATAATLDLTLPAGSGPIAGASGFGYRIDLSGTGFSQIAWIELADPGDNSTAGATTGFDLDAIVLDGDGDLSTTGDQSLASSYLFTAGTVRGTGILDGTDGAGNLDNSFATLETFDATTGASGTGYLSMGDNGVLRANFNPAVALSGSLFVFTSDIGARENLGRITISDMVAAVPLPAGGMLLLTALGVLGLRRKRA